MGRNNVQLTAIAKALAAQHSQFVDLLKVDAPNTTIVGRAQVTDFSKDLKPRMGIERIITQSIQGIEGEAGPNGEVIYGVLNDVHNRIRLGGTWVGSVGAGDTLVHTSNLNDFIEITFYGTDLNLSVAVSGVATDWRVSVDGGAEGGNIYPNMSTALASRNYSQNIPIVVASGLSLGMHTVKVRHNSAGLSGYLYGFEVINDSNTLDIPSGEIIKDGRNFISGSLQNIAYNSSWADIQKDGATQGSLSTKGGRVLVYGDLTDGAIKKKIVEADSTQKNLTSADHSNESMIRKYNFREFGAGRTDDFSRLEAAASDKAFALSDGTTTLSGDNVAADVNGGVEQANPGFYTLTFVGTGLDIETVSSAASGSPSTNLEVFVDGVSIGSIPAASQDLNKIIKIVSGLPYGAHTVKFNRDAGTEFLTTKNFITYGPEKPILAKTEIEIAEYYLMADFVANATQNINYISTGVLRKDSSREITVINGTGGTADWTFGAVNPAARSGVGSLLSDRTNAYVEHTFFGTGFDLRFDGSTNRSNDISVTMNGTALTAANFPTANFNTVGVGVSYNSGTGSLDQLTGSALQGCGFSVDSLPLAKYTVRFNNNVASSYLIMDTLDIITPIHFPDSNKPAGIQNNLPVGSQALGDLRGISELQSLDIPNYGTAIGITSGVTTTSTTLVPVPDMFCIVKTKGNPLEINAIIAAYHSVINEFLNIQVYVDGKPVGTSHRNKYYATGAEQTSTQHAVVPVAAGVHIVQLFWATNASGTLTTDGINRYMTAKEIK